MHTVRWPTPPTTHATTARTAGDTQTQTNIYTPNAPSPSPIASRRSPRSSARPPRAYVRSDLSPAHTHATPTPRPHAATEHGMQPSRVRPPKTTTHRAPRAASACEPPYARRPSKQEDVHGGHTRPARTRAVRRPIRTLQRRPAPCLAFVVPPHPPRHRSVALAPTWRYVARASREMWRHDNGGATGRAPPAPPCAHV